MINLNDYKKCQIFVVIMLLVSLFVTGVQYQAIDGLQSDLLHQQEVSDFYISLSKSYKKEIIVYQQERMITVDVSAYTNRVVECDSTPNITAIMNRVVPGYTVAVSHDLRYMLGHRIYIYGLGVFLVNDLMDDRWVGKVDIYYDKSDLKLARRFGLKKGMDLVLLHKVVNLKYEEGKIRQYD